MASKKRTPTKRKRAPLRPDEKSPRSGLSPVKASPEKSPKKRSPPRKRSPPKSRKVAKKGSAVAAVQGGAVAVKKKRVGADKSPEEEQDPPTKRLRNNSRTNEIDSPEVAAASSTLLYKSLYEGGGAESDYEWDTAEHKKKPKKPKGIGKKDSTTVAKRAASPVESESEEEDEVDATKSGKNDEDYTPDGLAYSDDDDFLLDVDSESEDERLRTSFPKDNQRRNLIPGGPQPPDLDMFPESERGAVWTKYKKERKKYCDNERQKRLRTQNADGEGFVGVSGDQSEQLRPMTEVEKYRLIDGQIFKSKDILQLRIAEEANLRGWHCGAL